MWILLIQVGIALLIAIGIVWWTLPSRPDSESENEENQ
jgi:hypothetical protein